MARKINCGGQTMRLWGRKAALTCGDLLERATVIETA
jgi:hypothetical protein